MADFPSKVHWEVIWAGSYKGDFRLMIFETEEQVEEWVKSQLIGANGIKSFQIREVVPYKHKIDVQLEIAE